VPSMLLQPLIENSIKHGLEPRLHGGTITLRSRIDKQRLLIDVEDDGVGIAEGRSPATGLVRTGAGIGMKNVRERLEVLFGAEAVFEVESRPGRGTRVTISLPLLLDEANQHMTAVPLHHQ
jgi:two-component system LytT family sensor kinase